MTDDDEKTIAITPQPVEHRNGEPGRRAQDKLLAAVAANVLPELHKHLDPILEVLAQEFWSRVNVEFPSTMRAPETWADNLESRCDRLEARMKALEEARTLRRAEVQEEFRAIRQEGHDERTRLEGMLIDAIDKLDKLTDKIDAMGVVLRPNGHRRRP